MTPTDLIQLSLRQIGVLGRGQSASKEQLNDAQTLCNMMLGQWARKRWLIFHLLELYATGNGNVAYRLGPGGDFSLYWDNPSVTYDQSGITFDQTFRTNRVEKAFVRQNAGTPQQVDIPLAVMPSAEDYSLIPVKNQVAGFPQAVYLDPGYPTAVLRVYPAPSNLYQVHILILNPLVRLSTLNVDINLPDEYLDAIFFNLCRRLLNSYRKPQDPEIVTQAQAALNTVKNANFQLPELQIPSDLTGGAPYSIYTDGYR